MQPFFRGMNERQLEWFAEDSNLADFKAGKQILHKGKPANRFYLILEGQVKLESPVSKGKSVHLQTLGKDDALGWSWLFPPYLWHFNAWAVTPTKAIFFNAKHLRGLCAENHYFGYELMKRVSEILIKRLEAERSEVVK